MRKTMFLVIGITAVLFLLAGSFYGLGQRGERGIEAAVSEEEIVKARLDELVDVYYDEDLDKFLSYFSEDDHPNFTTFEEDMENTFDNNNDLIVSLTYLSTVVNKNTAIVKVNWQKTWDDSSTDSGNNNTIRLKKIDGEWKITDLQDSSIFTIGAGTVSGSVTDR